MTFLVPPDELTTLCEKGGWLLQCIVNDERVKILHLDPCDAPDLCLALWYALEHEWQDASCEAQLHTIMKQKNLCEPGLGKNRLGEDEAIVYSWLTGKPYDTGDPVDTTG